MVTSATSKAKAEEGGREERTGGKKEKSSRAGGGQCAGMECRELHGGSGVLGFRALLSTLAKVMLQETQTPEKAHDVVGIPSNRVVQKAGGNWTVHHHPTPRSCCLELVYCVVILSITRTHTLRLVLRQKAKRTRFLLFIHSMCNSLHLFVPNSQSIPPPAPSLPLGNHKPVLYVCESANLNFYIRKKYTVKVYQVCSRSVTYLCFHFIFSF